MRTPMLFAAAFVLAALVPSEASAARSPSLDSIPETRMPDMLHPKDSPSTVAAEERIEGVTTSFAKVRQFGSVNATEGRCVTIGAIAPGAVPSGNSSAAIRVAHGAMPLRIERFVGTDAGKPELELVDGWVDMTTTGMREERKTKISLTSLGKGPAGYEVYGFRSEGKLHVVFPMFGRFALVDASGKIGFGGCGHARLIVDPAATGGSLVHVAGTIPQSKPKANAEVAKANVDAAQQTPWRGIEASVSVSRTKRDKQPLLSVTVAWAEDEPSALPPQPTPQPVAAEANFQF